MGAVDVGVRHHDDLVVALVGAEFVAHAGAERGDQRADLLQGQHLVLDAHAFEFDVEDLAAQRQHRLEVAVAAHGAAAGRVALDNEQFGFGGILFLALSELARQRSHSKHLCGSDSCPRAASRAASLDDLADDNLGLGWTSSNHAASA